MSEPRLVIDTAPRSVGAMSEVGHEEPRPAKLGNDFVVNLVDVLFPGQSSRAYTPLR